MKNKKNIIVAGGVILAVLLGVGYFFAKQKSEPVYLSKIDKIMFERENRSPKYVITLPDKDKKEIEKREAPKTKAEDTGKLTLEKLVETVPNLKKLEPMAEASLTPLENVNTKAELLETVDGRKLPRKHKNRQPWIEYGRKVEVAPNFYKVAILVKKMGLDTNTTGIAYKGLPSNVSFSFSPYANELGAQILEARKFGHETYVDIILLSENFMISDTGPKAVDLSKPVSAVVKHVQEIIATKAPVGGVLINRGIYKENGTEQLKALFQELDKRGLLMVDATENEALEEVKSSSLPRKRADVVIDGNFERKRILKQLEQAEEIAKEKGQVLVVVTPKPVSLLAIHEWVQSFSPQLSYEEMVAKGEDPAQVSRPFALVPVSAVVVE